jgi:hypothetical protein
MKGVVTLVLLLVGATQVLVRCVPVRSGEVAAGTKAMQNRKSSGYALSFLPPGFLRIFRVELK